MPLRMQQPVSGLAAWTGPPFLFRNLEIIPHFVTHRQKMRILDLLTSRFSRFRESRFEMKPAMVIVPFAKIDGKSTTCRVLR